MTTNREQRARDVLYRAIAERDPTGAGQTRAVREGRCDVGAAIDAMLSFSDAERSAQSEPGDDARDIITWLEAIREVVREAHWALEDSEDRTHEDPPIHAVPHENATKLDEALRACENFARPGDAWDGPGPLVTRIIDFLAAPTPPQQSAPAIPAGMVPWHGGDSAPEDWDGGPVLFRCGETGEAECDSWSVGTKIGNWRPNEYDIIAYTPKQQSAPASDVLREALDEACALIQEVKGIAGPGSVTDHLDFAESWIEKIHPDFTALTTSAPQRDQLVEARAALRATVDALTKQHQWHAAQTAPDPQHGFIPADEYADSELCDETVSALSQANWLLADGAVNQALSQPSPSQGEERRP